MRLAMLAAILLLAAPPAGPAQEGAADPEKFRRLVEGLPSQSEQQAFVRELRLRPTKANQPEIAAARAALRRLRERLPALMASVKPGTSILDYPGLLALGLVGHGISHDGPGGAPRPGYWLHVGVALTETKEGSGEKEFIVRFDERGTVLDVDDLVCRH